MPKRRFTEQERADGDRAWRRMSEKAQLFYENTPLARLWKTEDGFFLSLFGEEAAGPFTFEKADNAFAAQQIQNEFLDECDNIADECEAEGHPSHGSNYESRVQALENWYKEQYSFF